MSRSSAELLAVVLLLAASNILVSSFLGLGDAEALYYCYGEHPSLSYLDHPPLIGWLIFIATTIGGPSVIAVRAVSLTMTVLALVFTYLFTRDLYGSKAAGWSSLLLLAAPVFSVGMVAATPDAPLVALWPLFTWQLYRALVDERAGAWSRLGRPLLLGLLLGLSFLSKYTGACLGVTAILIVSSRNGRVWLGRPGFWLGTCAAIVTASPVLAWNIQHEWAGLLHRLVWTQEGAGFSLRNAGALIGGQLLYVGPLTLPLLLWAAVRLWRARAHGPEQQILLAASLPALAAAYLLVLWSDVAEPHWPAAAYMPLFVGTAGLISGSSGRVKTLARTAVCLGIALLALLHVLVQTPLLPALSSTKSYRPEYDLGNELRGWPEVAETIRSLNHNRKPVVAAFYTQCSQLTFALNRPGDPEVRCVSPEIDDFDIWFGPFVVPKGGALFVTDNRFEHNPRRLVPGIRSVGAPITIEISRGGRWVRRFSINTLVEKNRVDNR